MQRGTAMSMEVQRLQQSTSECQRTVLEGEEAELMLANTLEANLPALYPKDHSRNVHNPANGL